jgi:hypothetical protein
MSGEGNESKNFILNVSGASGTRLRYQLVIPCPQAEREEQVEWAA